jgi:dTDP-4-amino-4,6-dideoxygalactose transaminase
MREEIREAMDRVLESQHFILGPEVEALEREVASYCGARYGVAVSSGSDALLVSLMALGVGAGDEVVTTPFTFFATVGAILRLGATPVFADINPDDFNIDPDQLKSRITACTKAIIPVHLFGQSADMAPILEAAKECGAAVIEDAAQAIGAEYYGRRVGSLGTTGCFSFFPSKNLGAFGDGGMVTLNDANLADRLVTLRNHGAKPKYFHRLVGGNFRLDALQAAILRVKLKHLDGWTEARRKNASYYDTRFSELGLSGDVIIPPPLVRERHVYNQYVIRAARRDELKRYLQDRGVYTEIYYPLGLHLQECLTHRGYVKGDFPRTEEAANSVLALPVYPELTDSQKDRTVEAIRDFYRR